MLNARLFTQPCVRLMIKDVLPFRAGNSRLGQIRSALPKFQWSMDHSESRKIRISPLLSSAGLPEVTLPSMSINCRKFLPGPNDVLGETYEASDGTSVFVEFPPFACK